MRRREFITLLGSTAAWPLAAQAQQTYPGIHGTFTAPRSGSVGAKSSSQSQSAASFSAMPTSGSAPLTVEFTASSGDANPSTFYIDFDDGGSGAPGTLTTSHTYSAPGTYAAALKRVAAAGGATVLVATIRVIGKTTE
jgi:PKD repeat protein